MKKQENSLPVEIVDDNTPVKQLPTKAEIRKVQKGSCGLYVNIPAKLTRLLDLTGDELVKFVVEDRNKIVLEIIRY